MGLLLSCCFGPPLDYDPYPHAYGPPVYVRDSYYDPYYYHRPSVHVVTAPDAGFIDTSVSYQGGGDNNGVVSSYSGSSGFAG